MRKFLISSSIVLTSFFLSILTAEFGLRVLHREIFDTENSIEKSHKMSQAACEAAFDTELGWSASPNAGPRRNAYGTRVTTGEYGLRNLGSVREIASTAPVLLAVGDSFTFGDEVNDGESWPSYLQTLVGNYRVANAGVCGYGIDQTLLRAERLVSKLKPKAIVFSFIYLGIDRSELTGYASIGRTEVKPYFVLKNGKLALKSQEPRDASPPKIELPLLHRFLGYSHLMSALMVRVAPQYWRRPFARVPSTSSGEDGTRISCALMERLAEIKRKNATQIVVMAQYGIEPESKYDPKIQEVLGCARKAGLQTLDLKPAFDELKKTEPKQFAGLFGAGHMAAKGNQFVAEQLVPFFKTESR